MTEEIKKIDIKKDLYLCSPLLNKKCTKENCYINNGCCCHTVNKKYSQEHLLNYITNLQKENENLKSVMFTGRNYNEVLKSEQDYKSRNEKAVEYIENPNICIDIRKTDGSLDYISTDILLNILKGGDE